MDDHSFIHSFGRMDGRKFSACCVDPLRKRLRKGGNLARIEFEGIGDKGGKMEKEGNEEK